MADGIFRLSLSQDFNGLYIVGEQLDDIREALFEQNALGFLASWQQIFAFQRFQAAAMYLSEQDLQFVLVQGVRESCNPSVAFQVEDVGWSISEHQVSEFLGIPVFLAYDIIEFLFRQ